MFVGCLRKSVKYEQVYLDAYDSFAEARALIMQYLNWYNRSGPPFELGQEKKTGLFAPVELIVIEEDQDQSSLTYVRPSSLMVVGTNEPLLAAAKELDAKLQALAAKVTA